MPNLKQKIQDAIEWLDEADERASLINDHRIYSLPMHIMGDKAIIQNSIKEAKKLLAEVQDES